MTRELAIAVLDKDGSVGVRVFTMATSERLASVMQLHFAVPQRLDKSDPEDGEKSKGDEAAEEVPEQVGDYALFAWDWRELDPRTRVNQIPRPGVVLALHRSHAQEGGEDTGFGALLVEIKRLLVDPKGGSDKMRRHLEGPWSRWRPQPLSRTDVLVIATADDEAVVSRLEAKLDALDLSHLRAVRAPNGGLGDATARQQLVDSQVALCVLSSASLDDPRILCEAGACWALGKPIVPVLIGLTREQLPRNLAAYQAVVADDPGALELLSTQVAMLVTP
jgi:hypothetical protein